MEYQGDDSLLKAVYEFEKCRVEMIKKQNRVHSRMRRLHADIVRKSIRRKLDSKQIRKLIKRFDNLKNHITERVNERVERTTERPFLLTELTLFLHQLREGLYYHSSVWQGYVTNESRA